MYYNEPRRLHRHGSALSISSNTHSVNSLRASGGGMQGGVVSPSLTGPGGQTPKGRGLAEKLAELETFRDILCRQVDALQGYFDVLAGEAAAAANSTEKGQQSGERNNQQLKAAKEAFQAQGLQPGDFKGESITFKATTAGIVATLGHCIDIMSQREDAWRKRLEKEINIRRTLEDKYRNLVSKDVN